MRRIVAASNLRQHRSRADEDYSELGTGLGKLRVDPAPALDADDGDAASEGANRSDYLDSVRCALLSAAVFSQFVVWRTYTTCHKALAPSSTPQRFQFRDLFHITCCSGLCSCRCRHRKLAADDSLRALVHALDQINICEADALAAQAHEQDKAAHSPGGHVLAFRSSVTD